MQKSDARGAIETIFYGETLDEQGRRVFQKIHTDPMGLQTIETYDVQKRLVRSGKRKGKTLSLEEKRYDGRGLLVFQANTVFSPHGSIRSVFTR